VLKQRAETAIIELADESFSPVCLRLPEVYGVSPQFRADLPLNRMVCDAFTTGIVTLADELDSQFATVHVEDAAAAFACTLLSPKDQIHSRTFGLGSESGVLSRRAMARAICEALPDVAIAVADNVEPGLIFAPRPSLAHAAMPGCRPQWTIQTGIRQMVDAFCRAGFAPEDCGSRRFHRGAQLAHLLRAGEIQPDLHWKRNFGEELATWAA
jgi:nucleoside-diphosphate-sugar epimerase